jgi:predicted anti-sigma-YlaC factor YlaD
MDDEMNEEEKEKIEKHLSICTDCRNQYRELMSLRQEILAAYLPIEIPVMFEERVMGKIQQAYFERSASILNFLAFLLLFAFGIMLFVTASPFLTVGFPIFYSVYSIGRGLIYAIPSIISAVPYVAEVITVLILSFIALAIITLRYLVHTMGKTVRAEDI